MSQKIHEKVQDERFIAERFLPVIGEGLRLSESVEDRPDRLIETVAGVPICGVELAGIRQTTSHDRAAGNARALCHSFIDQWINNQAINLWMLHLDFRVRSNRDPSKEAYLVPRPNNREAFIAECVRLAEGLSQFRIDAARECICFVFDTDWDPHVRAHLRSYQNLLAAEDYPLLEKHCIELRFTWAGAPGGMPSTNLGIGFVGVDWGEFDRVVQKHLVELPGYRRRVCEVAGCDTYRSVCCCTATATP